MQKETLTEDHGNWDDGRLWAEVGEWTSWDTWSTSLASDAYGTQPGSPEREKVLADALKDRPDPEQVRKFAALRSRGEPSVPAQLALDGLDRQLRRR